MAARRRGGGCLRCGCWVAIPVILLLIWVGAVQFRVLERLGLRQSAAERMLSGPPDRAAADALRAELESAGISTRGIELYVLPITGREGSLALAVLDPTEGFRPQSGGEADILFRYLRDLALGQTARQAGIVRVTVDFRDEYGDSALTVTAPAEAIEHYAQGRITRQEFLRQMFIDADWLTVLSEVLQ